MADLRAYAREAAGRAGIDPDRFVRQIQQESGFDPDAHNDGSGADGIAQIVVRWHPTMAGKTRDPYASLDYAAGLMRNHLAVYDGDWALALSCYNAGPGATASGLKGTLAGWPYAETVRYVANILQISQAEARRRLTTVERTPVGDVTALLTRIVELGKTQIGKPYSGPIVGQPDSARWGNPGFDCSSFASWLVSEVTGGAIVLPGFTDAIYDRCEWVQSPQPGDLVFYHYPDSSQPGVTYPHMGIWLSPTEVLDARYGRGVGIGPHVTPIQGPDGRYRRTMRPKGLANVAPPAHPPVQPPVGPDPRDARIAELEAQVASLKNDLDGERTKLGVLQGHYMPTLRDVVNAIGDLKASA